MTAKGYRAIWLLVGIVALGLALRLYRLGALGLAGNEDYLAISVDRILEVGVPEFPSGVVYPRALPLAYLTAALVHLFGASELVLRLPSVLFSTSVIAGVFLLGRRLISAEVGLLAAFLVAVSDWEIEVGRTARMYAMLSACCVYCVWLLHRATVEGGRPALAALAALSAATAWVHQLAFALGAMYATFPLRFEPNRRRIRVWTLAIGVVALSSGAYYALNRYEYAVWDEIVEAARGAVWEEAPDAGGDRIEAFASRYLTPFRTLAGDHPWALAVLTAAAAAALLQACRLAYRRPDERLFAAALGIVVVAIYFQQLMLASMAFAAYLLIGRALQPESYGSRSRRLLLVLAVAGLGWLAFSWWISAPAAATAAATLKSTVKPLVGYPPSFVRLFLEQYPATGLLFLVAVAVAVIRFLRAGRVDGVGLAALLFLVPSIVLGFHPQSIGRTEARYVSFLHPYFLLLAAFGAVWLAGRLRRALAGRRRLRAVALGLYVLALAIALWSEGGRQLVAYLSADYGINEDVRDRRREGHYFHPDLAGSASYVGQRYAPGDVVIAMDILGFYAYLANADYQLTLFGKPDAEGWLAGRSIESADELASALDRHADRRVWIALSGAHSRRLRGDPRFDAILRVVAERAGEPVYRGRDGLSDVYVVPRADDG